MQKHGIVALSHPTSIQKTFTFNYKHFSTYYVPEAGHMEMNKRQFCPRGAQ